MQNYPSIYRKTKNGKQNQHTTSRPLPLSILSVVATTFPPFRCRSHIILRRDTCGNICCILSTSASLARMLFADVALLLCDEGVAFDEKKKYLMARPASRSSINSCGRFMVCSSIVFTLALPEVGSDRKGGSWKKVRDCWARSGASCRRSNQTWYRRITRNWLYNQIPLLKIVRLLKWNQVKPIDLPKKYRDNCYRSRAIFLPTSRLEFMQYHVENL
jgi:hypothetical protein